MKCSLLLVVFVTAPVGSGVASCPPSSVCCGVLMHASCCREESSRSRTHCGAPWQRRAFPAEVPLTSHVPPPSLRPAAEGLRRALPCSPRARARLRPPTGSGLHYSCLSSSREVSSRWAVWARNPKTQGRLLNIVFRSSQYFFSQEIRMSLELTFEKNSGFPMNL